MSTIDFGPHSNISKYLQASYSFYMLISCLLTFVTSSPRYFLLDMAVDSRTPFRGFAICLQWISFLIVIYQNIYKLHTHSIC